MAEKTEDEVGVQNLRKISRLLLGGFSLKKIMELTGQPYSKIYRQASFYEKKQLIERDTKYPLTFKPKRIAEERILPPQRGVGDFSPTAQNLPLFITHKFGASFSIMGGQLHERGPQGKRVLTEPDHKALIGRSTCVIWLKELYLGMTPDEIIQNGRNYLYKLADRYAARFGLKLVLKRFYEDVEWVLNDKPASQETAEKAGIEHQALIHDVIAKYNDSSHPDYLEINQAPGHAPAAPTEFVRVLHLAAANRPALTYLLERGPEQMAATSKNIEAMTKTLEAMMNTMVVIKTAQEMMIQEMKKNKGD